MNWGSVFLWGFVATMVLTGIMIASQNAGLHRMSITFLIGSMFTPSRRRAHLVGAALHFVDGWAFAIFYGFIFESLGRANIWIGALIGLVQGLFVLGAVMPLLPSFHPRMATEQQGPSLERAIQPPGFLALHYGVRTPFVTALAHAAYGAILGAFYHLA